MTIYHAHCDSSHFEWDGYGYTAVHARQALLRAWHSWAEQSGAYRDYLKTEDINIYKVELGQGYMDHVSRGEQPRRKAAS